MPTPTGDPMFDAAEGSFASQLESDPTATMIPEGFEKAPQDNPDDKLTKDDGSGNGDGEGGKDLDGKQSTTAEGGDQAKSKSEEDKGALPEYLKPHEKLLTEKNYGDYSKPEEFIPKVLESYAELEQHSGNRGRENSMLNTRKDELTTILSGDVDAINAYRKTAGLTPLPVDSRSFDDKLKDHDELVKNINAAFVNGYDSEGRQTQEGKAAFDWLQSHFASKRENLLLDKKFTERVGDKKSSTTQLNAQANQNAANLRTNHPNDDVNKIMDSVLLDPVLDPLFSSFDIGPLQMMSTPERAQAAFELAKLVHKAKGFDEAVKAEVAKQMDQKRKNGNLGTGGESGQSGGSKESDNLASQDGFSYAPQSEIDYLMKT